MAIRRSEGLLPEWFGGCAGTDDRGARGRCGTRHLSSRPSETTPLACNSASSRRTASRWEPSNATSSRAINSLVVRPRGNASIVFRRSDIEYFAPLKYAQLDRSTPGGPRKRYCPSSLSSRQRQQSSNTRRRVCVDDCPRHVGETDQGSTMSTPVPLKSLTLRVTRTARRERDMAAIWQSASPIGRPARRRPAAISA